MNLDILLYKMAQKLRSAHPHSGSRGIKAIF